MPKRGGTALHADHQGGGRQPGEGTRSWLQGKSQPSLTWPFQAANGPSPNGSKGRQSVVMSMGQPEFES